MPGRPTSLAAKLANILVTPGEVFDEVITAPPRLLTWAVPTLLVCLASLLFLGTTATHDRAAAAVAQLMDRGEQLSTAQVTALSTRWQTTSYLAASVAAFAGTAWSAFVLWFISRVFHKTSCSFSKALEVASLAGMILVLGTVTTALLVFASGNAAARPALSLLAGKLSTDSPLFAALDALNFFHLWTTAVLAIGLSRLSGVSFRESAFWVFGYWLLARLALILLA